MNSAWVYLWIALLVFQATTLWVHRRPTDPHGLNIQQVEPELLELAQKTNQLMHLKAEKDRQSPDETFTRRSVSLVRRESLILELQRLQKQLLERGVETHVVDDLEAFLGAMDDGQSIPRINAFIVGILDWLRPHAKSLPYSALERLSLFPGNGGTLPVLAFELSGTPEGMAQSLLWSAGESSRWDLVEIDLMIPRNERSCWLRGSFAFMENMNPL